MTTNGTGKIQNAYLDIDKVKPVIEVEPVRINNHEKQYCHTCTQTMSHSDFECMCAC